MKFMNTVLCLDYATKDNTENDTDELRLRYNAERVESDTPGSKTLNNDL